MLFKKRKGNQNKIKPPGRKRKIITTIALSLSLLFGKARLSSSQSSNPNFGNQEVHQTLIDDREFNSFEDNDRQVILAKTADSAPSVPTSTGRGQPSNFPTPPSGNRPSRPVYVPKYRTAPKVVDPGLGAAANPAGNGGGAPEFEDNSPVPKKEQAQESKTFDYDYRSNDSQKKKKSKDQCPIDEQNKAGIDELPDSSQFIYNLETKTAKKALKKVWKNSEEKECEATEQLQVEESYKSNSDLKKVTKNAHKSKRAVKNLEDVEQKLSEGKNPMKIGYKPTNLGNGFYYIRKPNARIVVKIDPTTGNSDIVAFAIRSNDKNMETLATVVNSQCDTKIKINPKAY